MKLCDGWVVVKLCDGGVVVKLCNNCGGWYCQSYLFVMICHLLCV